MKILFMTNIFWQPLCKYHLCSAPYYQSILIAWWVRKLKIADNMLYLTWINKNQSLYQSTSLSVSLFVCLFDCLFVCSLTPPKRRTPAS